MKKKFKNIAITGGKGGTGKSTVSVLLANDLLNKGKKVILCDCDVECPNDYLILNQKLKESQKKIYAEFPKLNKRKCKKCGLCSKTCRSNAIFQAPGKYPIFIKDLCSACGACSIVCPNKAIELEKEEIGQIFLNQIKENFWLVTGLAKSGLEETGPVVTQTKKFVSKLAEKIKPDFILLDTAAGTHCPVISALLDCDLSYIVTEPTPMGNHDLSLILDLCQKLKLPTEIILNQSDLGVKTGIDKIAKKFKTKIKREIPYSKKIAKAYSKGQLLNFNI